MELPLRSLLKKEGVLTIGIEDESGGNPQTIIIFQWLLSVQKVFILLPTRFERGCF